MFSIVHFYSRPIEEIQAHIEVSCEYYNTTFSSLLGTDRLRRSLARDDTCDTVLLQTLSMSKATLISFFYKRIDTVVGSRASYSSNTEVVVHEAIFT